MKFIFIVSLLILLPLINTQECRSQLDKASAMRGRCQTVNDCTGAAIEGDCLNGLICCVNDIKPAVKKESDMISLKAFLNAAGDTRRNNVIYFHFIESLSLAGITKQFQVAAFIAQLIGETKYFRQIESSVAEDDFNTLIGNDGAGQGVEFRGRGGILLKGRANYVLAQKRVKDIRFNILKNPETVAYPSIAFKVAAWFWRENAYVIKKVGKAEKGNLNELCDGTFINFAHLTHALTSNLNSLKERASINDKVLKELEYTTMKRGQGVECELKDKQIGYAVPICLINFKKPYCGCNGQFQVQTCPYGFMSNDKCRNSAIIKCCVEKCDVDLDLAILMDASTSVGKKDFDSEKSFVREVVKSLQIGQKASRVAIVKYNAKPTVHLNFKETTNKKKMLEIVESLSCCSRGTRTDLALQTVNQNILKVSNGMRPAKAAVPKVILTITDGYSNKPSDTKKQADLIKRREFNMISVGVGKGVKLTELLHLSSTPNDQYSVDDFDKINDIIYEISKTTCEQPAEVKLATNVSINIEKNSYKYFKFQVEKDSSTQTYLARFTVEMNEIDGSSDLFYSFSDNNPKSESDYIKDDTPFEREENFIELRRQSGTKYVQIENKDELATLYFSIKGLGQKNSVEVTIHNRTLSNGVGKLKAASCFQIVLVIVGGFFNIFNIA